MIGFVQNTNITGSLTQHPITCFYAEKDKRDLYEDKVSSPGALVQDKLHLHLAQTNSTQKYDTTNDDFAPRDRQFSPLTLVTQNHTEDELTKAYGPKRPQRKDK